MKKLLLLLVCSAPLCAQAQTTVNWATVQKVTALGDADTVYFSFRGSGIFAQATQGHTAALNPPDQVAYNGAATITVRRVGGEVIDSLIAYGKGVDFSGRVLQRDSTFLFGTSYAAPSSPNSFGDGRLYGKDIQGLNRFINGLMIVYKVFDIADTTTSLEWGLGH